MRTKSGSIALCFGALLLTPLLRTAHAQVVADTACPYYEVDIAAFATCEGRHVARAEPVVARISPSAAALAKSEHGRDLLLLDVRSHVEAAFGGRVPQADALVPYAEVAQPLQWDAARGGLALETSPYFADLAQAWIAVLGGDLDTPLLLLCSTGEVATTAARVLRASGYRYVTVIDGGLEGAQREDGPQHAGWKAAGLPWLAHSDAAFLFGESD
jgi:rhodanese-related sulfurtransferase